MLNVDTKEVRTPRSFTLKPSNIQKLQEMADAYNTNQSRIVEAMIEKYGDDLLDQKIRTNKGKK